MYEGLKTANTLCLAPGDKDAKLKLLECEKMVQKIEFLKAIEVGDPPSAAEGLNLDEMGESLDLYSHKNLAD